MKNNRKFYQIAATLAGDWREVNLGQVMSTPEGLWVVTGFDRQKPGVWIAKDNRVIFVCGHDLLWESLSIRFMPPKAAGKDA